MEDTGTSNNLGGEAGHKHRPHKRYRFPCSPGSRCPLGRRLPNPNPNPRPHTPPPREERVLCHRPQGKTPLNLSLAPMLFTNAPPCSPEEAICYRKTSGLLVRSDKPGWTEAFPSLAFHASLGGSRRLRLEALPGTVDKADCPFLILLLHFTRPSATDMGSLSQRLGQGVALILWPRGTWT